MYTFDSETLWELDPSLTYFIDMSIYSLYLIPNAKSFLNLNLLLPSAERFERGGGGLKIDTDLLLRGQ